MTVKINTLELENVKRVKAVVMDCTGSALTVIGGNNGQGKTSVLDAITYCLGGERFRPSTVKRDTSLVDPEIKITLSNGITVERRGKNSSLKVIDENGVKQGQALINDFIHMFALDLPRFMNASAKEKANTLLQIIGIGPQLEALETEEKKAYESRHVKGQIADQKKKFALEMPFHADAPEEPVSAQDLINQQQAILIKNGENQQKRQQSAQIEQRITSSTGQRDYLQQQLNEMTAKLATLDDGIAKDKADLKLSKKTAEQLEDESVEEIKENLAKIEEINVKVRANLDRDKANDDAQHHSEEYNALTEVLEGVRKRKAALLDDASLPLPGLSVLNGELVFNGKQWDCMSSSEQLKVATAIVRKLNPECGFVLLDKLEQMDLTSLREFGLWLEAEGLQAIATRVSTGSECSVIIEDGTGTLAPNAATKPADPASPEFDPNNPF